jgi:secreted trypsin-like serine protease
MRSSIASRAALLATLALGSAACGGSESDDAPNIALGQAKQAIQGGQSAGTKYPFVLGILIDLPEGRAVCSGTLIAPNLVLTARHCVSAINSDAIDCKSTAFTTTHSASDMSVTVDTEMHIFDDFNGNYLPVAKVVVPTVKAMCGHDVALLILEDNIPASVATLATPMIWNKITDGAGVEAVTAIGYGTVDGKNDSGTRRIRKNIPIECAYGHPKASMDCDNVQQDLSSLMTESDLLVGAGVCEGDSGSSAFEQDAFDQGIYNSVGILSRGPGDSCDLGVYTRVDALKDIILDAAAQAAEMGGYDPLAWTFEPGTAPPPSTSSSSGAATAAEGDACTEDAECEDGLVCTDGACAAEVDAGAVVKKKKTTTTTTTGCSIAADPTKPIPWRSGSSVAFMALGVGLLLRRRSSR